MVVVFWAGQQVLKIDHLLHRRVGLGA
eukprot:SAG11_NODE_6754_length_1252_cov_2.207106_2_plen_26_part_01